MYSHQVGQLRAQSDHMRSISSGARQRATHSCGRPSPAATCLYVVIVQAARDRIQRQAFRHEATKVINYIAKAFRGLRLRGCNALMLIPAYVRSASPEAAQRLPTRLYGGKGSLSANRDKRCATYPHLRIYNRWENRFRQNICVWLWLVALKGWVDEYGEEEVEAWHQQIGERAELPADIYSELLKMLQRAERKHLV